MSDIAIGRHSSAVAESITTTHARPRAFLAAIALAATFAVGLVSGLAVRPALPTGSEPVTVGNAAISAQAAGQAHALWLKGELDSYGTSAAGGQAHMLWLRGEINSYGSSQASPVGSFQSWLANRQFRLSEEGYTR